MPFKPYIKFKAFTRILHKIIIKKTRDTLKSLSVIFATSLVVIELEVELAPELAYSIIISTI